MTKIIDLKDLITKISPHQKIVLATGVFDILHSEHEKFLQAAKKQGDLLLVGLESDDRVKQLKGSHRPLNPIKTRLQNLAALDLADYVFVLPEDFDHLQQHEVLIQQLHPHILAVSSQTPHQSQKQKIMAKYGGQLKVVLPHNPQISTSKLIRVK